MGQYKSIPGKYITGKSSMLSHVEKGNGVGGAGQCAYAKNIKKYTMMQTSCQTMDTPAICLPKIDLNGTQMV